MIVKNKFQILLLALVALISSCTPTKHLTDSTDYINVTDTNIIIDTPFGNDKVIYPNDGHHECLACMFPDQFIAETDAMWERDDTITYSIHPSCPELRANKIIEDHNELNELGTLHHKNLPSSQWSEAIDRITCDDNGGGWAYVGTTMLRIPKDQATTNIGWDEYEIVVTPSGKVEVRRLIRHEAKHKCGFTHVQLIPPSEGGIVFDTLATFDWCASFGWSQSTCEWNILRYVDPGKYTIADFFDVLSIMLYSLPCHIMSEESREKGYCERWNKYMSAGDTLGYKLFYGALDDGTSNEDDDNDDVLLCEDLTEELLAARKLIEQLINTNEKQTGQILELQRIQKLYETKIIQLQSKERKRLDLIDKFRMDFKRA